MKKARKIRRQQVKDTVATVSPWDLSGTPEEICKELRETQDAYLKNYDDIVDATWSWENPSFGDSEGYFALSITRLENDKEYDSRVKQLMKINEQEKILKQKQEQFEYEEYLRLKQKFDKTWKNDWSSP